MIKPNDLRIGNILQVDQLIGKTNIIETVKAIRNDGLDYFEGYYLEFKSGNKASIEDHYKDRDICVKAIPLTREWLLRMGFKEDVNIYRTTNYSGLFLEYDMVWHLNKQYADGTLNICYGLQYVHELQNLYFALTKEELNVTF